MRKVIQCVHSFFHLNFIIRSNIRSIQLAKFGSIILSFLLYIFLTVYILWRNEYCIKNVHLKLKSQPKVLIPIAFDCIVIFPHII